MTDILETMADEIAEAVEILRPHHPQDSEAALRHRAEGLRSKRYQSGRWPTSDELAEKAWEEAWEEAHVEDAIREAAKAARCEPERARAPTSEPEPVQSYESTPPIEAEPPPRKRGRPKGSKNHPKAQEAVG